MTAEVNRSCYLGDSPFPTCPTRASAKGMISPPDGNFGMILYPRAPRGSGLTAIDSNSTAMDSSFSC